MKKNAYIDLLANDIDNHFYKLIDEERLEYNKIAYAGNNSTVIKYESKFLSEMLNFYLNELEFTPDEFISFLNSNARRLTDFLYGYHLSFINNRDDFQKIFESPIKKDRDLFLKCIKICLNEHQYAYKDVDKMSDIEKQRNEIFIAKNRESFIRLLKIGIEEKLFFNINSDDLYTKNSDYKKIMNDMEILEDKFNDEKLIELIKIKASTKNAYFLYHIKEISEFFSDIEFAQKWLHEKLNNSSNDNKPIEHLSLMSLFISIIQEKNEESVSHQYHFASQWLKNPLLREEVLSNIDLLRKITEYHPNIGQSFLISLTQEEIKKFLNEAYIESFLIDDQKYWNKNLGTLSKLFCSTLPFKNRYEILEKLIEIKNTKFLGENNENYEKTNAYHSAILNYACAKTIENIKIDSLDSITKEQEIIKVLKLYVDNKDSVADFIKVYDGALTNNIEFLQTNLDNLNERKIDLNLSLNLFTDIQKNISNNLKIYFKSKVMNIKHDYGHNRSFIRDIKSALNAIKLTQSYDALNGFEDITKVYDKIIDKKTMKDIPIIFEILGNTDDERIISWIFKEEHCEDLKQNIKYKGKNIVDFFIQTPKIEKIVEILIKDKTVFKALIMDKKKTFTALSQLNNQFIQTSLSFMVLDHKLKKSPSKNEIIKNSNKI